MLIECLAKRNPHTVVTLDADTYVFKPQTTEPNAPHVCKVDNEGHLGKFLTHPADYRIAPGLTAEVSKDAVIAGTRGVAAAATVTTTPAVDATQAEPQVTGQTGDTTDANAADTSEGEQPNGDNTSVGGEGNAASEGDSTDNASKVDVTKLQKPFIEAELVALAEQDIDALKALSKSVIGKEPHPNSKPETIVARIMAENEG